jgi:hypothetical protein
MQVPGVYVCKDPSFHCNSEHGLSGIQVNTIPNIILPLDPLSFPSKCNSHQRAPLEDERVGAALDFLGVVEVHITLDITPSLE